MSTLRNVRSRLVHTMGVLVICVLALTLALPVGAAPGAQTVNRLSKHNRELLAQARAEGKRTVTVLIAATPGANQTVANRIGALGGKIRYRENAISYLRAVVPTDKVEAVAALNGVDAVDLNEIIALDDPRPAGAVVPTPQTPPSAATPRNNPYMPIGDTGAAQFMAAHPTWDGRGVVVGMLDTGVTLDHPSLLTTSTGERKIINWVTYTDPFEDADPTWVDMTAEVSGATFTFNSVTYTAPAAGTYRIGLFNERDPNLGGEVGSDVNRDGNPTGSSGIFAVLWNMSNNNVWVDTNQNQSFADQAAMTDYAVNFDVGTFGTDNPATPVREAMPFVVQTDAADQVVNIGIVSGQHGSHVAGIISGNSLFGGAMSGAAPGAKLISLRACLFVSGCTSHALVEGMAWLAAQGVDVISMSIGGLPALNDGNNARAILYNRLIETYDVQMFISAGNSGPGINSIGDPSVADWVMSIGAYVSKATLQSNYGSTSAFDDNLNYFTSPGPREDGGFKPNVVAPGAAISTTPMWQPGGPVGGTYALPPGYSMLNGTSMAAPQASGATALLISAAKQTGGVQYKPRQIRQALNSSARFLGGYVAAEQGNGLINVGAAWDLLKTNIQTVTIHGLVPVNTLLSSLLFFPGLGQGIYDREGVSTGESYTRQYTFTRNSGSLAPVTYNLQWVGNDGTFSTPATITLPRNTHTTLTVGIHPTTAGVHSAILNLDDPSTVGIDYQTMNTVMATDPFNAGNNYSITYSGSVGINRTLHYFFDVPAGTPAFKVDFSGPSATPGTGQARFLRYHPYGVNIDSNASTSCFSPSAGSCAGSPLSRTVTNPQAGVWEVTVDARRTSDAIWTPFTLTGTILGATVAPNPDTIASATIGVPVARSYTLTNQFGPFTGRAVGTTLGSAQRGVFNISTGVTQIYNVTIPMGTTSLRATIGGASDPAADLDLFVDNCTAGPCVQVGSSADGDSEESVTIANPAAGAWRIRVDGFAVPSGSTNYNYVDVFVNAAFGSVAVTDANALRPSGSSWMVPGTVTALSAPASGRVLQGSVEVRTDTNILVGSGEVIVQSVTP